jgi:hypothetical protein
MGTQVKVRAKPKHYVDNKKFYTVILQYKQDVKEAAAAGKDKPRVPNYVGECLLAIASRLSTRPNFVNYPFREEMVSDGIENCLQYFDNFNPERTNNPFAYFTQIIYFAFLRRIYKEKRQLYIKYKSMQNLHIMGMLADHNESEGDKKTVDFIPANNDYMDNLVKSIESKIKVKKPKPKTGIENFYDQDSTDS